MEAGKVAAGDLAFPSRIAQTFAVQVVSRICLGLFVPVLLAGLASCRTIGGGKDPAAAKETAAAAGGGTDAQAQAAAPVTLPVGVVHHVDETARFVLIRSSRGLQLEPGTVLSLHGSRGETTARVEVSPARKGSFLTADFIDGLPAKGQQVTMTHQRAPLETTADPFSAGADPNAVQVLE